MATAIPLLADNPVDHMPRLVRRRPGAERLLHLWVEPLLRVDPTLHHPSVDPTESGGALQRRQLAKRNSGVVLIQVEQQDPCDTSVQTCGPLQELDPVPVRQVQIGGHQRHLLGTASQPPSSARPSAAEPAVSTPIVRPEPAVQR